MSRSRSFLASAAALFSGALLPAGLLFAGVTSVPTDVQMPGTQPGEVSGIQGVDKCDNCHGGYDPQVEPYFTWQGSAMSHATRDPLFWASVAVAEQDFPGAGDLCLRCHTPDGWLGGRSTPTDGSTLVSGDADGVSCDLCHRLTNPDLSEHAGTMFPPYLANDESPTDPEGYHGGGMFAVWNGNSKLGPYLDATPNHQFMQSKFHRSSELCGTCHDVSNPVVGDLAHDHGADLALAAGTFSGVPGAPVDQKAAFNNPPYAYGVVERTFSEHQASAFEDLKVSQYASLPPELQAGAIEAAWLAATAATPSGDYEDGTKRTFSCQTCHMPPVEGYGANKSGLKLRKDLPRHRMVGGNYWISDAIEYLDAQGKLVVGGGLSATQKAAMAAGDALARENLENSASLVVEGDVLKVVNLTGHKLISGYPEGRRMWLHTTWRDAQGQVVREDGAYGDLTVSIGGQSATVRSLLDLDHPNTRVYQVHAGVTQEWANQLLGLGYPATLPLVYDRVTGQTSLTLGDVGAQPPGTSAETFHFVLVNTMIEDNRIPPYGFRYDDALARNVLPKPETQFGAPGPGGVFDHWDEVTLNPPTGAVTATVELLYQPTSWEYVQFLALANDGSETFLASTGQDLLDAWRNTGMAEPHVMATATWGAPFDPWADLGFGLAGTNGTPVLAGTGSLAGGTTVTLTLSNARPQSTAALVIGLSTAALPFFGGTLVPSPDVIVYGLPTGPAGTLALSAPWPNTVPSGVNLLFQEWIVDPGGPQGYAASNAVMATTP